MRKPLQRNATNVGREHADVAGMNCKPATVEAAWTQEAVERRQCDIVMEFDTLREAKAYAKRVLTDDFQRYVESSQPCCYSRVMVGDECVADYFRR